MRSCHARHAFFSTFLKVSLALRLHSSSLLLQEAVGPWSSVWFLPITQVFILAIHLELIAYRSMFWDAVKHLKGVLTVILNNIELKCPF